MKFMLPVFICSWMACTPAAVPGTFHRNDGPASRCITYKANGTANTYKRILFATSGSLAARQISSQLAVQLKKIFDDYHIDTRYEFLGNNTPASQHKLDTVLLAFQPDAILLMQQATEDIIVYGAPSNTKVYQKLILEFRDAHNQLPLWEGCLESYINVLTDQHFRQMSFQLLETLRENKLMPDSSAALRPQVEMPLR